MESLDGAGLEHALGRGKVDQVIGVNDQRAEPEVLPPRAKGLGIHLGNTRRSALPHSGAGREDLQRVATQLAGRLKRIQIAADDGGVDADSNAAIHPGWRLRFRLRFRAILVLGVEFCRLDDGLFRHA
jgi:hypothetical protein